MSKQKHNMPKPVRYKCNTYVLGDAMPVFDKPGWEELYYYGMDTGDMAVQYDANKDRVLGYKILERMQFERDAWLRMNPPEFPGAAKKSITMVSLMFNLGYDKHAINAAKEEAEQYIALSPTDTQAFLREVYNHNLFATSLLACCAMCGKHTPPEQKRLFCSQCKIAVYCGPVCQKKHWDEAHRAVCTKQRMCAACGKLLEAPMTCGRCNAVWYCNKDHQKHHWKKHKNVCVAVEEDLCAAFAATTL
jgi:hypothetical protein